MVLALCINCLYKLSIYQSLFDSLKKHLPHLFHGFRNKYLNTISLDNMLYFHSKLYKFWENTWFFDNHAIKIMVRIKHKLPYFHMATKNIDFDHVCHVIVYRLFSYSCTWLWWMNKLFLSNVLKRIIISGVKLVWTILVFKLLVKCIIRPFRTCYIKYFTKSYLYNQQGSKSWNCLRNILRASKKVKWDISRFIPSRRRRDRGLSMSVHPPVLRSPSVRPSRAISK